MTREQLGALILDSERQLYSTAKTILYSDQDCADAIQDTIVKAFSKIDTLKNDKYARTWLVRILINECYSILRKSSKLVSLEEMNDKGESGGSMKTCGGADKEAEKRADYAELYRAVNSLKEELRLPVILYYIEDFNIREIAQILDITEGAVQKRLARARGKLRMNAFKLLKKRFLILKSEKTKQMIENGRSRNEEDMFGNNDKSSLSGKST